MTCAICHGLRGTGGTNGPSLVEPAKRLRFDQIVAQILNPAPPMPKLYPLPLKRDEVDAIAHYVEKLN
jgi:mono/diheme cytochrome c family protein